MTDAALAEYEAILEAAKAGDGRALDALADAAKAFNFATRRPARDVPDFAQLARDADLIDLTPRADDDSPAEFLPDGSISLMVNIGPDGSMSAVSAGLTGGRVWNLGAGDPPPEGADLLTRLRAAQVSTLTEAARWRKISHGDLEAAIKAVESLGNVLALARLKWGNLDADANKVCEDAEAVLAAVLGD